MHKIYIIEITIQEVLQIINFPLFFYLTLLSILFAPALPYSIFQLFSYFTLLLIAILILFHLLINYSYIFIVCLSLSALRGWICIHFLSNIFQVGITHIPSICTCNSFVDQYYHGNLCMLILTSTALFDTTDMGFFVW